jgi:hypothetical protein
VWDVFVFDMRRQLRSRNFWYFLFGWALVSLLITAVAYAVNLYSRETSQPLEEKMESVFHTLIIGQGLLILLLLPGIAEGVLVSEFRRKTHEHLFLTALSARTILLGRWLMVGAQAGMVLLISLPAGLFACRISGLPISFYFISVFMLVLNALLACAFTFRRLSSEYYQPEWMPKSELQTAKRQSSSSLDANIFIIAGIGFFFWFALFSRRSEIILPVYAFSPPLVSFTASKSIQLGGISLPFWIVAGTMLASAGFFLVLSSAQWLGDWSGHVYRVLRNGGLVWFQLMVFLHAYLIGSSLVRSNFDAAHFGRLLLYAGLGFYCYFCYSWTCSFGMPRRAEEDWQQKRWSLLKRQPLSGSIQEIFTFIMMAILVPTGIYLGSGWLPDTDVLLGWLIYFVGLSFFLAALASRLAWQAGLPLFGHPQFSSIYLWVRMRVETATSSTFSLVLSLIGCGVVLRLIIGWHPVITVIATILYYLIPLYPLIANASPSVYEIYGALLFLSGIGIILSIQTSYRRSYTG